MKSPVRHIRWRLSLAILIGTVFFSSCAPNIPPVIIELEAEKDWVTPLGSTEVYCVASDADGDDLTYTWTATSGTFSGTGPTTTWTAPDIQGSYIITVTVADDRGGEGKMQLNVDVQANDTPVIESLTAEQPTVRQGEATPIECIASDPDGDELSYLWVTFHGSISGEGSTVTWTAPYSCGNYVVTVTVTDGRGGETSEDVEIEVIKPG